MKRGMMWVRAALLMTALIFCQLQAADAAIEKWADPEYDFKGIQSVYISDINLAGPDLSDIQARVLQTDFWKQVNRGQPYTVLNTEKMERKISLKTFQDLTAIAAQDPVRAESIWQAEMPGFVNAYAETVLHEYRLEPYVIPAHTELRTRRITDYYYDSNGKRHEYTREIPYTEFVPERHTCRSIIDIRFDVYDAATRKTIFSRHEYRVDSDSDDLQGMFGEVVRGCLRDFRKKIR